MPNVNYEYWIIKDGIVLCENTFDSKMNSQMMGGFFSAFDSMAKEIQNENLASMKLSNKVFYFAKDKNILFIIATSTKEKPKKLKNRLDLMVNAFFSQYDLDKINNWNGDSELFEDFDPEYDPNIDQAFNAIRDNIW